MMIDINSFELIDIPWFLVTAMFMIIAWLRYRAGLQRYGSLIVASLMAASIICIVSGLEIVAEALQIVGLVISGLLIYGEERWKRSKSQNR